MPCDNMRLLGAFVGAGELKVLSSPRRSNISFDFFVVVVVFTGAAFVVVVGALWKSSKSSIAQQKYK